MIRDGGVEFDRLDDEFGPFSVLERILEDHFIGDPSAVTAGHASDIRRFEKPSAFGELWYAEAEVPTGPWGRAVKVLSHDNYTFYNPRLHPEFTPEGSPILIFEGTYTAEFADRPPPTPRYNYNQMLYRLDLDDPALAPAQHPRP